MRKIDIDLVVKYGNVKVASVSGVTFLSENESPLDNAIGFLQKIRDADTSRVKCRYAGSEDQAMTAADVARRFGIQVPTRESQDESVVQETGL